MLLAFLDVLLWMRAFGDSAFGLLVPPRRKDKSCGVTARSREPLRRLALLAAAHREHADIVFIEWRTAPFPNRSSLRTLSGHSWPERHHCTSRSQSDLLAGFTGPLSEVELHTMISARKLTKLSIWGTVRERIARIAHSNTLQTDLPAF